MSRLNQVLTTGLVVGLFAGAIGICLGIGALSDLYAANRGVSDDVTGVVAARSGADAFIVVSGASERVTSRSSSGTVRTRSFPRLTSYRLRDGEAVARRHYQQVAFRTFSEDTAVWALLAESGRVFVVSTERDVGLHAVDPATLEDVVTAEAITASAPALADGLHVEGVYDAPVAVHDGDLLYRVDSGAWLALRPDTLAERRLPDGERFDDAVRAGPPPGDPVVEALVEDRPEWLEPEVIAVRTLDGNQDGAASFVVTRTSLNDDVARLRVTRFATASGTPVEGWTTTLDDVPPTCCDGLVWRGESLAVLWYEEWLVAFDDASGEVRWKHRL